MLIPRYEYPISDVCLIARVIAIMLLLLNMAMPWSNPAPPESTPAPAPESQIVLEIPPSLRAAYRAFAAPSAAALSYSGNAALSYSGNAAPPARPAWPCGRSSCSNP